MAGWWIWMQVPCEADWSSGGVAQGPVARRGACRGRTLAESCGSCVSRISQVAAGDGGRSGRSIEPSKKPARPAQCLHKSFLKTTEIQQEPCKRVGRKQHKPTRACKDVGGSNESCSDALRRHWMASCTVAWLGDGGLVGGWQCRECGVVSRGRPCSRLMRLRGSRKKHVRTGTDQTGPDLYTAGAGFCCVRF